MTLTTTFEWALFYEARGWSIIPIRKDSKEPSVCWKTYQRTAPDTEQLKKWFNNDKNSSIAVILGRVSGNLACRDFDKAESYEAWANKFPDLAQKLPTIKTSRGYHVYFKAVVEHTVHYDDGELRGEGSYCLLPPSFHPCGVPYQWIVELNDDVPEIDPEDAGMIPVFVQSMKKAEPIKENRSFSEDVKIKIHQAIEATIPSKPGERNRRIFQLVLLLRGIPDLADLDNPCCLRPFIVEWHQKALPFITTKAFAETLIDFMNGWKKAKFSSNPNLLNELLERAKTNLVPDFPHELREPIELHYLVSLCRELQNYSGDGSFFLPTRNAGKVLGVDHSTAWRWLNLLVFEGWLEVVDAGCNKPGHWKSAHFRYLGDLEKNSNGANIHSSKL